VIDRESFHTRTAQLEAALHAKLRLRGKSLEARLGRAGRLLPKRLHRAGRVIADARMKLDHPRMARMIDYTRVSRAFADFEEFLAGIDPADRRKGAILGWLGALVFNLLLATVCLTVLYRWLTNQ